MSLRLKNDLFNYFALVTIKVVCLYCKQHQRPFGSEKFYSVYHLKQANKHNVEFKIYNLYICVFSMNNTLPVKLCYLYANALVAKKNAFNNVLDFKLGNLKFVHKIVYVKVQQIDVQKSAVSHLLYGISISRIYIVRFAKLVYSHRQCVLSFSRHFRHL